MRPLLLAVLAILMATASAQSRMEILEIDSHALRDNPLRDPVLRRVAVFLPAQHLRIRKLPLVLYLPGFGGSSEDAINAPQPWIDLVQRWADAGLPVVLAIPDGRNRFGCSQYIDSPASGRYLTHLCDEVVPAVERRYHVGGKAANRVVAGHSSGGFGALRIGLARKREFGHVVALSPDCDFVDTHLPLVKDEGTRAARLSDIERFMPPTLDRPEGLRGEASYVLALSACYAPEGTTGRFNWPYDADGTFREDVWDQWLANDPLTIVRANPRAFTSTQTIYLDGAASDEFRANVGARRVWEALKDRRSRVTFDEPPGSHGDHLFERLTRGVMGSFGKPTPPVE